MKNKLIYLVYIVIITLLCFTSCNFLKSDNDKEIEDSKGNSDGHPDDDNENDDSSSEHIHRYVVERVLPEYLAFEATCNSGSVYCYSCECGAKGVRTFVVGDPISHEWKNATCLSPKTCDLCGATEGTVREHLWEEATCQHPKRCLSCGITVGNTSNHNYEGVTCTMCGKVIGSDDGTELPVIPFD